MQVTAGAEWFTGAGNKRSYAVAFSLDDLRFSKGDEHVDALNTIERWKELNVAAEKLVVVYLSSEGVLSTEQAQKRINELNNG